VETEGQGGTRGVPKSSLRASLGAATRRPIWRRFS